MLEISLFYIAYRLGYSIYIRIIKTITRLLVITYFFEVLHLIALVLHL